MRALINGANQFTKGTRVEQNCVRAYTFGEKKKRAYKSVQMIFSAPEYLLTAIAEKILLENPEHNWSVSKIGCS